MYLAQNFLAGARRERRVSNARHARERRNRGPYGGGLRGTRHIASANAIGAARRSGNRPYVAKSKQLSKKVRNIEQKLKASDAKHTRRRIDAAQLVTGGIGQQASFSFVGIDTSELETALNSLRYYDPAVPGTLVTANGATGTYARNFLFKRTVASLQIRNNYTVDVHCKVYAVIPRQDGSVSPGDAWANGMADQGNPGTISPMVFPTDSAQFRERYHIEKSYTRNLKPGQEMKCTHANKPFFYDPSQYDSHTLPFNKRYGSVIFLVLIRGDIGHDSADSTQVDYGYAAVDMLMTKTYEIIYDAGTSLEDYSIVDGAGAVVSAREANMPISDVQGWSAV